VAELVLGFKPDTRKWLLLEEEEEDENMEASQRTINIKYTRPAVYKNLIFWSLFQ
jgi:hypothetical protein